MSFRNILGLNERNRNLIMVGNRRKDFHLADDKAVSKRWMNNLGLPVPRMMKLLSNPSSIKPFLNTLECEDGFVVKPNAGARGNGVAVVKEAFGADKPVRKLRSELLWHMQRILSGEFKFEHGLDSVLVEERVKDHDFTLNITGLSGADLRIICWKGKLVMSMLRLSTRHSGGRANLHQGGIGVGIDLESGQTTHAIHRERPVERHPDTGIDLGGHQIPDWHSSVIPAAEKIARHCPLEYCGIDMMLDRDRGPLVVELNARPGLAIQLANRKRLKDHLYGILSHGVVAIAFFCLFAGGQKVMGEARVELPVEQQDDSDSIAGVDMESSHSLDEATKLVTENPRDPAAYNDLAVALRQAGDHAGAEDALLRAIELSDSYHRAFYNLGTFYLLDNRLDEAEETLTKAITLRPFYTEALYNLGIVKMRAGRFAEAAEHFEAIGNISKSSRHAKAYYNLGLCRAAQQNYPDAIRAYRRALHLDVGHAASHINLGIAYAKQGMMDEARESYGRALALDPENWRARFNLSIALSNAELYEEALDALAPLPEDIQKQPDVCNQRGNILMALDRAADAETAYRTAYRRDPQPEYLYNLARAQRASGDDEGALVTYREVLRINPEYHEAWFNVALLLDQKGNIKEAKDWLTRLLDAEPDHAGALYTLGNMYKDEGDPVRAIPLLKRVADVEPANAEYWFALGLACRYAEQMEDAKRYYSRAESLNPYEQRYPYNLGLVFMAVEQYKQAVAAFDRALAVDPVYYEALYNRGLAFLRWGKSDEAITVLEDATQLYPDRAQAWNNLGLAYADRSDLAHAAEAYGQAIKQDQGDATAYFNLALLYRNNGKIKEAEQVYRMAFKVGAVSPSLLNNLALLESEEGYFASAERLLRRALEMDPGYEAAAINLSGLLSKQGQTDKAIEALKPFFEAGSADAELFFNHGMALLRSGQESEAAKRFQEAIRLRPDYVEARHNLGLIYLRRGELEKAEDILSAVAEIGAEAPRTLLNLALAQSRAGDVKESMATLQSIVDVQPDYVEAHYNLGLLAFKTEDYARAELHFNTAVKLRKAYPEAWYNLGLTLLKQKNREQALVAFRQAVSFRNEYPEAWYNIGVVLSRTADPAMIEAFTTATQQAPENGNYFSALGRSYQKLKQYVRAADAYSRAIGLLSKPDEKLFSRRAFCLSRADNLAEADAAFRDLVQRYPDNMTYRFNYAVLKSKAGNDVGAGELYQEIISRNPGYCKAWNNLAYVHMRAGRLGEARKCLEYIQHIEPGYPGLSSSMADLEAREKDGEI